MRLHEFYTVFDSFEVSALRTMIVNCIQSAVDANEISSDEEDNARKKKPPPKKKGGGAKSPRTNKIKVKSPSGKR